MKEQDELRKYISSLPSNVKESIMQSSIEIKSVDEAKKLVENLNKE